MTSSIGVRRRLWTPETKISYESESKHLLTAVYAICDIVRRKSATSLGSDIKTSKTQSSDRTSPGGVLPSVPVSASAVKDKSHTGLYDPMSAYRTPPTRLPWLEDPKVYERQEQGSLSSGAGIIFFRYVMSP